MKKALILLFLLPAILCANPNDPIKAKFFKSNYKVLDEVVYPNATPYKKELCTVKFVSTNGNDETVEKLVLEKI